MAECASVLVLYPHCPAEPDISLNLMQLGVFFENNVFFLGLSKFWYERIFGFIIQSHFDTHALSCQDRI